MMSTALLAGTYSSVWADGADYADGDVHTIGVVLYDPDSAEMEKFRTLKLKRHLLQRQRQRAQRESFLLQDMRMDFRMRSKPVENHSEPHNQTTYRQEHEPASCHCHGSKRKYQLLHCIFHQEIFEEETDAGQMN